MHGQELWVVEELRASPADSQQENGNLSLDLGCKGLNSASKK